MRDLFGVDVPDTPPRFKPDRAHPAPPGTGPAGQTCGTCAACWHCPTTRRRYYKCNLMPHSNGPATDIALKTPACRHFTRRPVGPRNQGPRT